MVAGVEVDAYPAAARAPVAGLPAAGIVDRVAGDFAGFELAGRDLPAVGVPEDVTFAYADCGPRSCGAGLGELAPAVDCRAELPGLVLGWFPGGVVGIRPTSEVALKTVSKVPVIRAKIRQQANSGRTMPSLPREPRSRRLRRCRRRARCSLW